MALAIRSCILCLIILSSISVNVVAMQATPSATPMDIPADCPITQPTSTEPDAKMPAPFGSATYENDALATNLWMWGEGIVEVPGSHVEKDGSTAGMKWAWYRHASGTLTITGKRLDAPADLLRAEIPTGYGDSGFQVSGIVFSGPGCWEITGTVAETDLTFVVWVEYLAESGTPGTTT